MAYAQRQSHHSHHHNHRNQQMKRRKLESFFRFISWPDSYSCIRCYLIIIVLFCSVLHSKSLKKAKIQGITPHSSTTRVSISTLGDETATVHSQHHSQCHDLPFNCNNTVGAILTPTTNATAIPADAPNPVFAIATGNQNGTMKPQV